MGVVILYREGEKRKRKEKREKRKEREKRSVTDNNIKKKRIESQIKKQKMALEATLRNNIKNTPKVSYNSITHQDNCIEN